MSQAIALLKTALALLILLQSTTNVPAALRDQANAIVNDAIQSADQAIADAQNVPATPTSIPTPLQMSVTPAPTPSSVSSSGSVTQNTSTSTTIASTPAPHIAIVDADAYLASIQSTYSLTDLISANYPCLGLENPPPNNPPCTDGFGNFIATSTLYAGDFPPGHPYGDVRMGIEIFSPQESSEQLTVTVTGDGTNYDPVYGQQWLDGTRVLTGPVISSNLGTGVSGVNQYQETLPNRWGQRSPDGSFEYIYEMPVTKTGTYIVTASTQDASTTVTINITS